MNKLDEGAPKQQATASLTQFATDLTHPNGATTWAAVAAPRIATLRQAFAAAGITLPDKDGRSLTELDELAAEIVADEHAAETAQSWASGLVPVLVYIDEYPELTGHQNITEYLNRKRAGQTNAADENFARMCKVAGIDPQQLNSLHEAGDHETRNQLANRAGAVITGELRRLWKDRQLKVRFSPDAQHLDTFVADPNSQYDVEVNLDERSRGLKWFFSFYITFPQIRAKVALQTKRYCFSMSRGYTYTLFRKPTCSDTLRATFPIRSFTPRTRPLWCRPRTLTRSVRSTSHRIQERP